MRYRFMFMLLLFFGLSAYIGWHGAILLDALGLAAVKPLLAACFVVLTFAYLLGRLRILPRPLRLALKLIGSYYFAVFEFAVILLPVADIAGALLAWSGVGSAVYVPLLGVIVVAILAALLLRGSYNAWTPIVRRYPVDIDKDAGGLSGLRIAVASDIHLGDIVENRYLNRLVDEIGKLEPDLVLFAGDVLDDAVEPFLRKNMADVLKRLKARYGVYAVLGNHEYYGGGIEAYVNRMREIGIPVLRDETVIVEGKFAVAGRKDKAAESMDPDGRLAVDELLAQVDSRLPIILLDHQPHHLERAEAAGADIMLSGHTHRGQFMPNHLITRRLFELDWGYKRKGRMHAIVSSGYGTWGPPIRIGSRSEIVEVVVTFTP
ncbi:metallophosphoesterase [Paenibacillus chartarius]|uniref:Metallophosphoesterase n=1 Tax=Paenibacillus chartarius TaxID=747481 RepID=A0ABV6DM82_9BACL